jgi:hypothetical protein
LAKAAAAKANTTGAVDGEIQILEISKGIVEVCIVGVSPLICNRMSEKARQSLILPTGRMTTAQKAVNLKHDPLAEFRSSPYINSEDGLTRIQLLASMFKGAMKTAALDLPGVAKSKIGRLVYVEGDRVEVYGIPQVMSAVTRSSDMNRTPDVRTRAILPRWACRISIAYVTPMINQKSVLNLLAAGGITAGIGDWRVEKGSGSYGQYKLVAPEDSEFLSILEEGRVAQDAGLANPIAYDDETGDLLQWFNVEIDRRGRSKEIKVAA